jgi:hypothetical protein
VEKLKFIKNARIGAKKTAESFNILEGMPSIPVAFLAFRLDNVFSTSSAITSGKLKVLSVNKIKFKVLSIVSLS